MRADDGVQESDALVEHEPPSEDGAPVVADVRDRKAARGKPKALRVEARRTALAGRRRGADRAVIQAEVEFLHLLHGRVRAVGVAPLDRAVELEATDGAVVHLPADERLVLGEYVGRFVGSRRLTPSEPRCERGEYRGSERQADDAAPQS